MEMPNRQLARGLCLAVIALLFSVSALQYDIGTLSNAGPGLFPLVVSSLLLLLALITIAQSFWRGSDRARLVLNGRNIGLITAALVLFTLSAEYVSTLLGIVLLVFVAGFAANSVSWRRNVEITIGLTAIAYVFERFLGLNLGLFSWKF